MFLNPLRKFTFFVFFCSLISGCLVQSLNPYYTEDLLIERPELNGKWIPVDDKNEAAYWVFDNNEITVHGKTDDKLDYLDVHYFKLDNIIFIDLTVTNFKNYHATDTSLIHLFPVHTVYKLKINRDSLTIIPLNKDWFEEAVKNKEIEIPFITSSESEPILYTNYSSSWVDFLKKYGDNHQAFDEKFGFILMKINE